MQSGRLIALSAALLLSTAATAQVPSPRVDRIDWATLMADAGARSLDVYSTRRMLTRGDREKLLPAAIAVHTPAMVAYSAGVVLLDGYIARKLAKYGHRKLARTVILIDGGQDAFWAVHNLYLKRGEPK
jgi:hypothetical protein